MSGKLVSQVLELDLPQHEKFVAVALASFGWDDGSHIYPGVAQLARLTGYTDRRVQQILRSLENKGIIVAVNQAQGGRGIATVYQMYTEKGEILPPINEKGEKGETQERVKSETQRVKLQAKRVKSEALKGETIDSPQPKNLREPSIEPEERAADAAPPPLPPPVQPSKPKVPKPPTEQQALVGALAEVMGLDPRLNGGRLGKLAAALKASEVPPTPDVIRDKYRPGGWFTDNDWRGRRGELPSETAIRETWGGWTKPIRAAPANGNGHPARAAPSKQERTLAAIDEYMAECEGEPPPGVVEGRVVYGNTG